MKTAGKQAEDRQETIRMEKLAVPANTIAVIKKYNFTFQKRYGQNFLVDPRVTQRIVEESGVGPEDTVLEIGPGIGTLTQYLAEAARKVVAVEVDRSLIPILEETLAGYDNVTVLCGDILKTDLSEIAGTYNEGKPLKVVANLPYYITTPIVMGLFESGAPVSSVTVMVQKEVAQRMQASPGGKDYGALTLAVQYYASARVVANVPPNCFIPRPDVGSAVIRLDVQEGVSCPGTDKEALFAVIRAAFAQRRKTLANCLKNASELPYTREDVTSALAQMGLPETIRGEALSLEQFAVLTQLLDGERNKK